MLRRRRRALAVMLLSLAPVVASGGDLSPRGILERAFRDAYGFDGRMVLALETRNRHGEVLERRANLASKRIDGRRHTLVYFSAPEHLLGTRLLTIENDGRSTDTFVYLPSLGTVRRITSAEGSQSFLGTDLTYGDLERRRVGDLVVGEARRAEHAGEPVHIVEAEPRRTARYDRVEFVVAASDFARLETRYYKAGSSEPFRIVEVPRSGLREMNGQRVPTRLRIRSIETGTWTEVRVEELVPNPELDDRLFSAKSLEYAPPLPGLP